MKKILHTLLIILPIVALAQNRPYQQKLEQLGPDKLNTPNVYRTGSGAPGPMYWQQKADYVIKVRLDDQNQRISGEETITYTNNSPDDLHYLWVQLDQNMRAKDSETHRIRPSRINDRMNGSQLQSIIGHDYDGGFKISKVTDTENNPLPYTINQTMMRVDLPKVLKSGESFSFEIDWNYLVNDRDLVGGRSGYEYFEDEDNYLYTIAQFFPRMAVYDDLNGWQNKQFLGRGEFALPFGDYEVHITVPEDHIVASTGTLENSDEVLTATQRERFEAAKKSDKPVMVVTEKEARKNEKKQVYNREKTWIYKAENVRDFAFATSRKFLWDAMGVDIDGKTVMAMSYYPKEGNPLWEQYSTEVVAHTLRIYSRHTIPYPYPVAISVNSKKIGMEYPMICFNFGRPEEDGTYTAAMKYGMIGVIIHEVGHNFFPMIINSDERQWTWMDEGLNTFLQFIAEQEWERDFPSRRGPPHLIVNYMKGDPEGMRPIMTNSENILQFGNNAYGKAATALNILRETIMGRELFDFAFKEYSRRWAFKHPTPEDFFRTMEDASAVDLDWFWRAWFYEIDPVDISIENVTWYKIQDPDPEAKAERDRKKSEKRRTFLTKTRNKSEVSKTMIEKDPELKDFYNEYDPHEVTKEDKKAYKTFMAALDNDEKKLLRQDWNFYEISFRNVGGAVMPIIIEFTFKDNSTEVVYIDAQAWGKNENTFTKVFPHLKEVKSFRLDPYRETADINEENNYFPRRFVPNRFEMYKQQKVERKNPMQQK